MQEAGNERACRAVAFLAVVLCLLAAACQSKTVPETHRYKLEGKVVSIDRQAHRVILDHKAIPGYMAAMVMGYELEDEHALDSLKPGDQISADLLVGQRHARLENIVVVKKSGAPAPQP